MNRVVAVVVITILLIVLLILALFMRVPTTVSPIEGRAIFIGPKSPSEYPHLRSYVVELNLPCDAILKIKDKIYALGGYEPLGVAVILSEDLRPLCYADLKYEVRKAEKYDEDRFVTLKRWESYYPTVGSIAMYDSELNMIWAVEGNFTNFKVANNKIYVLEERSGGSCYLNIFDGNGKLMKSFKILDLREVFFNVEELPEEISEFGFIDKKITSLSIEVRDDKIYLSYTAKRYIPGDYVGPYKLMLLRFDEEGNLEMKRVIYETEEFISVDRILNHKDGFLLAVSSSSCHYIYIDEDGDIVGEAKWKSPLGDGCWAMAKVFDGRVYIFGWLPLFHGFVGLINESAYVNESLYYAKVQEIFVKKDSVWQDNSIVYDVLLDDKLYVIGLLQIDLPSSGAFIVKVDPNLDIDDVDSLLERTNVCYRLGKDIPPCKP